mmetsp:Transcript_17232/g.51757  ORF Transcript_17232/g.51757 Transcript_17232/m.51757 type:complete len:193 (-) Transcript_17232:1836-2414(-)
MTAVCAGDRLGSVAEYISGPGTYVRDGFIHASLVGLQQIGGDAMSGSGRRPIEVVAGAAVPVVPKLGDVVTAKVQRVQQNQAQCRIVCVGQRACDTDFAGAIRLQDVRTTEVDRIIMVDCFRPGDVVRAEVLSLGDARSYFLSTAKNELGVVYARSAGAGAPMVPTSWEEMRCPVTEAVEKRKVASSTAQPK